MDKITHLYHTMPVWFQNPGNLIYVGLLILCVLISLHERGAE